MAVRSESALAALFAAVEGLADAATVEGLRQLDLGGAATTALALERGAPTVEGEECSPWTKLMRRDCGLVVAAKGQAAWSALLEAVGVALAADRTLGGAVTDVVFDEPFETEETRVMGGGDYVVGVIPVTLRYRTPGANPIEAV